MHSNLGKTYTDKITGFRGVCVGRVEYVSGCNQLLLSPRVTVEGGHRDPQWFDEQRCDHDAAVDPIVLNNGATPGCDRAAPIR